MLQRVAQLLLSDMPQQQLLVISRWQPLLLLLLLLLLMVTRGLAVHLVGQLMPRGGWPLLAPSALRLLLLLMAIAPRCGLRTAEALSIFAVVSTAVPYIHPCTPLYGQFLLVWVHLQMRAACDHACWDGTPG